MSCPIYVACPTCDASPGVGCIEYSYPGNDRPPGMYHGTRHSLARKDMATPEIMESRFDTLDVTYDGVLLRRLIKMDEDRQRENIVGAIISPAQRAAISAYWSAQLRAKVEAKRKDDQAASVSVYVEQEIE